MADKGTVKITLVRRIYLIESEKHRTSIDRDWDVCLQRKSKVCCERGTEVLRAVRSCVQSTWPGGIDWDRDVEALRIYRNGMLTATDLPDPKLKVEKLRGEIHVWLHRPYTQLVQSDPTTYDYMDT